jgi:uncharacterized membrane protein
MRQRITQSILDTQKGAPVPEETPQNGLSENAACGLAYITIIPAIIFLVVAPYNTNRNVKFHAWQSIFLGIAAFAIGIIGIIPFLGWIIFIFGMLALFVVWIICVVKAFGGQRFVIPVIGALAEKQAGA